MADDDGWETGLLEKIEDFRRDELIDVPHDKVFKQTSSGRQDPVLGV